MTTTFHSWAYRRFIERQSNLRRKEFRRTNQGSKFFGGSFAIEIMQEPQSNLDKVSPSILKDDFFSRTDSSILTSIALVLLNRSNKTG